MPQAYQQGDEPVPGSGYRLASFLGRGGFGEVWKATAPGGAEAALKIIRLGGQEGRKEFRALQLVKRIRHPNLVPIVAFWLKDQDGGVLNDAIAGLESLPPYETTPVLSRDTMVASRDVDGPQATELIVAMGLGDLCLFDRLQQCRSQGLEGIPRDELLGYMEDVAEAIDFLNSPVHDLGSGAAAIQHCDIKPHNLMIVGGAAQVCDFGLARVLGADRATSAAASVAYAAPECLQTGLPSASTDQYSLAVSYYELRTGSLPYGDEALAAVMDAKQHERLDVSRVTGPEQAVLRRATRCDPKQRYPSAAAMVAALCAAAGGQVGKAVSRPAGRGRWIGAALAVLVLAGAAVGGWLVWEHRHEILFAGIEKKLAADRAPAVDDRKPPVVDRTSPKPEPKVAAADSVKAIVVDAGSAEDDKRRKESANAYIEAGTAALKTRGFDEAIASFDQAAKFDPRNARIFVRRAGAWFGKKNYPKVIEDLTTSLGIEQNDEDYVNRGRAYRELGEFDKAVADFGEAIRLNPQNATAFALRGDAYLAKYDATNAKRDLEQAIADLNSAVDACRDNPTDKFRPENAYFLRASCYMLAKDYDRAANDFTEVLRIVPGGTKKMDVLLDDLAAKFAEGGKTSQAIQWESKAIELASDEDTKAEYRTRLQQYRSEKR